MTECDHVTCSDEGRTMVCLPDGTIRVWCGGDAHRDDVTVGPIQILGPVPETNHVQRRFDE